MTATKLEICRVIHVNLYISLKTILGVIVVNRNTHLACGDSNYFDSTVKDKDRTHSLSLVESNTFKDCSYLSRCSCVLLRLQLLLSISFQIVTTNYNTLSCHSLQTKQNKKMGNCQAVDTARIVIQHPNGKEERLSCPVSASYMMKMNPGHCVSLLISTTALSATSSGHGGPLRLTRIKLLRPTDTLVLGHVYRLITTKGIEY